MQAMCAEEQISAVQHVDVVIRLLNLLPPGAEALAVRALSAVLKPSCMRAILCTAQHSMQQLSQHTGAQAWAKAASSATPLTGDAFLEYATRADMSMAYCWMEHLCQYSSAASSLDIAMAKSRLCIAMSAYGHSW